MAVKWRDYEKLKLNCKDKVQLSNEYTKNREYFYYMRTAFSSVKDGQLGQVNIPEHRITLTDENTQSINSAPYRAGPKTQEIENAEIEKMLLQKGYLICSDRNGRTNDS